VDKIDHFKIYVLCSGDVVADVYHLHVKIIHFMDFSYIVIEDLILVWLGVVVYFICVNFCTSNCSLLFLH
jgi:hypothetical protein